MEQKEELVALAINQHGYFTASQAESAGYIRTNHHYHVKRGEWVREGRGLYRHKAVPLTEFSHYWLINLQFRNLEGEPQAVFAGETALQVYELSDVNPDKVYICLPKNFRTTKKIPKSVVVQKIEIEETDYQWFQGLKVTTPIQTILTLSKDESFLEEHLDKAVKEGLKKGYFSKRQIKQTDNLARYAL